MGYFGTQIRRRLLLLTAVGLIAFLAFSVTSTLKNRALPPMTTASNSEADIRVRSFSFVQTGERNSSWTLRASEAELFEKTHLAQLREITATMPYGDEGQILIEGDTGEIASDKKNFFIRKNEGLMRIDLENRYSVETPGLRWNEEKRTLFSQGPVHISGLEAEINGNELAILVDKGEMIVVGDVKALVH